jgi:hypothetical protein
VKEGESTWVLEVYGWERTAVYKVRLDGLEEELVCWRAFTFLLLFETLGIAAVGYVSKR